jgi:predicted O-linked N-acetylglucosamine transferase (SPINDLY family)
MTTAIPDSASLDAALQQAVGLFNSGRHVELEERMRALIEQFPQSGFAWKVFGVALQSQGKEALPALRKAAELLPRDAAAHSNLGNALRELDQLDEAVASCRQALEIDPDYAMGHNNLGAALKDLGRSDEAAASCRRALVLRPEYAEAHSNLGYALKDLGELAAAVTCLHRALQVNSDYAEAHNNLGNIERELGQFDRSITSYHRALAIKPGYAEAHNNLGNVLQVLGQVDRAVTSCIRALHIKPDFAEAHCNLGYARQVLGQLDSAVASYRRALEIRPDFAGAHSSLLFIHNYLSDLPAATLLADARRFGEVVAREARPFASWPNIADPGRCLRIGFMSGDLWNHPVGYFLEAVLAALSSHAAGRLELIAYATHARSDEVTERIKARCHEWYSAVGVSDEALAARLRADGIDILVDLSGHTAYNRLSLFAWKPAPVQVAWLGYFATTGVTAIDYLVADPWTVPAGADAEFTEEVWRLPETRLCFTPPDAAIAVSELPALGNGCITFGCFNNLTKINDAVVALWARVLLAVPGSRLFLKAKQLGAASMRESVVRRFAIHGIGSERLIMEGPTPRADYLSAYHRVDATLDPFPFPGGTTSIESLWMGVPVLTLAGDRFVSRQGVGLLANAGLAEWIASDADDYVARAVSCVGDLPGLAALRRRLRQQVLVSPLFDARRFAMHFEAALRGMWTRWCAQP